MATWLRNALFASNCPPFSTTLLHVHEAASLAVLHQLKTRLARQQVLSLSLSLSHVQLDCSWFKRQSQSNTDISDLGLQSLSRPDSLLISFLSSTCTSSTFSCVLVLHTRFFTSVDISFLAVHHRSQPWISSCPPLSIRTVLFDFFFFFFWYFRES
jgi:hypothetical protein